MVNFLKPVKLFIYDKNQVNNDNIYVRISGYFQQYSQ